MGKLGRLSRTLEGSIESVSSLLLLLILILVFAEVVLRYIFGLSYSFIENFSKWSQIWVAYLMIGVVEKGRRHITIDFLARRLPEKYKALLLIVLDIITLVFCIILFWSGLEFSQIVKGLNVISTTEVSIPMWIVRLCIPLGAVFLAFFSVEHLAADIRSLGKYTRGEE